MNFRTINPRRPKTAKNPQPSSQVRIIGGQLRGRLVDFIAADGLRPTPGRLRETLFNWLNGHLYGAKVLDVCAGSGVLGFESLSRGAKHSIFIEAHHQQAQTLNAQSQKLALRPQCTIYQGRAENILPTLAAPFDIIFIDPPYQQKLWTLLLLTLIKHDLLHPHTLIYLEGNQPLTQLLELPLLADGTDTGQMTQFSMTKSTKVGQIYAYLLKSTHS